MKWLAPVAAACAAASVGTACGGATSAADAVAKAADTTIDAGSANVHVVTHVAFRGKKLRSVGDGSFDFARRHGRLSLSAPAGGATEDEVFSNGVEYVRSDSVVALPGGKHWMKVDFAKIQAKLGTTELRQPSADPTATLDQLRVAAEAEEVGRAKVGDVDTTRYHAVVDLRQLRGAGRTRARHGVAKLIRLLGRPTIPIEVWIDRDQLIRRERYSVTQTVPSFGRVSITLQLDLHDFGTPVRVQLPHAADVYDATDANLQQLRETP